ncbi:reverse transcriptase domain-containing protein [Tanacetum coccineum]
MPPRMRTRSAGWPATESLRGGTGERIGRGGRGRRPREGNDERVDNLNGQGNDQGMGANGGVEGANGNVERANGGAPDFSSIIAQQLQNLLPAMLAQVSSRGNVGNQNGNVVNENVQENVGNVIMNGNRVGCSYKEFLACNPKEYDGKGGVVVLTRWIKKMESAHDMSGCSIDQKVKYTAVSFVGKALTWWNSQIRTLSREVAVSMSWNDFKFMMIQEFCPSHEMQKLESELWNHAMVGAGHAAYTDRFHELARLVPHLVTPESRMIERYVYGLALQICGMVAATEPKTIQKVVQISGALTDEAVRNGSIKKVEKRGNVGEPSNDKNVRDDNKRTKTGNAFATTANLVGRENTGTWPKCTTCNSYYAPSGPCRTCFNYNLPGHLAKDCRGVPRNVNHVNAINPTVRACYECGSTDYVRNQGNQARGRAFMLGAEEAHQDPNIVIGLEPNELSFKYEIEIASGQLIEIDKVIKGCKLEIEGHVFDIDLIPFGHGSFDVIIGERPEEKARFLMGAKVGDKKQEEIVVVRDFLGASVRLLIGVRNRNWRFNLKDKLCNAPVLALPKDRDDSVGILYWHTSMQEALGTRLDMSTTYHPQTDGQSERTIQTLEDMLRAVRCAPFEALYGRKCRSLIMWAEVGEGQLIGPELVQETTEKISQIKDRLKDRAVALERCGTLWEEGEISTLGFVGRFEFIKKVRPSFAFGLDLPSELNGVHDTFHVSNLKKCLADPTLKVPLDEI